MRKIKRFMGGLQTGEGAKKKKKKPFLKKTKPNQVTRKTLSP
jgi:hypothetical protein